LILATLPAVAAALVFKDCIEGAFASGSWLGYAFLVTAAALLISEHLSRRPGRTRTEWEMTWLDALIIGILQGIAIIPGVSRSGFTLSGALSRKLDRDFAARFSFLLSIPAILGALVLQIRDLLEPGLAADPALGLAGSASGGMAPLVAGTVTAAVVGFASVKLMLKLVRERSLRGFAVYTAVLGLLVLLDQYLIHLYF
jgi:undecaprenyl-diphosphatase